MLKINSVEQGFQEEWIPRHRSKPHLSALKCGPTYENLKTKKELDREHRVPRQVLDVELLLENCRVFMVIMVTVGFVITKLGGVQISANPDRHKRGAFDSPQDRKAAESKWLLCSEPTCLCVARRVWPISLLRALKVGFWREWLSHWYSPKLISLQVHTCHSRQATPIPQQMF